jgi:hypothetical protein
MKMVARLPGGIPAEFRRRVCRNINFNCRILLLWGLALKTWAAALLADIRLGITFVTSHL